MASWHDRARPARLHTDRTARHCRVSNRYVVFSHGGDSPPWDRKASAMAEIARSEGYEPEAVDYRGVDTLRGRMGRLVDFCKELQGDLVLVGSGVGGYVALASASLLHARGLLLIAPAVYVEGMPELRKGVLDCPAAVVHGWRDEVVPWEHSVRFARAHDLPLHLVDGDHVLDNQARFLAHIFEYFIIALDLPSIAFE